MDEDDKRSEQSWSSECGVRCTRTFDQGSCSGSCNLLVDQNGHHNLGDRQHHCQYNHNFD